MVMGDCIMRLKPLRSCGEWSRRWMYGGVSGGEEMNVSEMWWMVGWKFRLGGMEVLVDMSGDVCEKCKVKGLMNSVAIQLCASVDGCGAL